MTGWRPILPMPVSVRVTGGHRRNYAPTPGFPWHNSYLPSDRAPTQNRVYPPLATADAKNLRWPVANLSSGGVQCARQDRLGHSNPIAVLLRGSVQHASIPPAPGERSGQLHPLCWERAG